MSIGRIIIIDKNKYIFQVIRKFTIKISFDTYTDIWVSLVQAWSTSSGGFEVSKEASSKTIDSISSTTRWTEKIILLWTFNTQTPEKLKSDFCWTQCIPITHTYNAIQYSHLLPHFHPTLCFATPPTLARLIPDF